MFLVLQGSQVASKAGEQIAPSSLATLDWPLLMRARQEQLASFKTPKFSSELVAEVVYTVSGVNIHELKLVDNAEVHSEGRATDVHKRGSCSRVLCRCRADSCRTAV